MRAHSFRGLPLLKGFCWVILLALAVCAEVGAQTSACATSEGPVPSCDPGTGQVQTKSGKVCGLQTQVPVNGRTSTINNFCGIPYAQAPTGALRWMPTAAPPSSWQSNTVVATRFGNVCPQFQQPELPSCSIKDLPVIGQEDCLYLNVWTPAQDNGGGLLPVMVFIHGGAFIEGTGSTPLFDGSFLAASNNVVVVSFNYRLGALGFLAYKNPNGTNDQLAGNFGFQDQQSALAWVQQNIQGFGGDKARVTIFGESAGAMSVGLHMVAANYSTPPFQAGIMESNPLGIPFKCQEVAQGEAYGQAFVNQLTTGTSCANAPGGVVNCMRTNLSMAQILQAQGTFSPNLSPFTWQGFEPNLPWTPVIDNQVIFGEPMKLVQTAGNRRGKALLLGTNEDEGLVFVEIFKQAFGWKILTKDAYNMALGHLFSSTTASTIESFTPSGSTDHPYAPVSGDNTEILAKVFTDYLFTCANRYFARQAVGTIPTFLYRFDQPTSFPFPACPLVPSCTTSPCPSACAAPEICHGAELPYVFHTASDIGKSFTSTEESVSRDMVGFWGDFARLLNPNGAHGIQWPMFNTQTGPYAVLDSPLTYASSIPEPVCDQLWDKIGYILIPPQTSCPTTGARPASYR